MPVHWQTLFLLPSTHRLRLPLQVRRDLFPRFERGFVARLRIHAAQIKANRAILQRSLGVMRLRDLNFPDSACYFLTSASTGFAFTTFTRAIRLRSIFCTTKVRESC